MYFINFLENILQYYLTCISLIKNNIQIFVLNICKFLLK